MAWIKTIAYNEADASLKRMYDRVKGPENNVDNVLLIHSLRPHTLTGHIGPYCWLYQFSHSIHCWI